MVKEPQAWALLFRQLAAGERHAVPAHEVAALLAQDPQWHRATRRLMEQLAQALRTQPLPEALATLPGAFKPETLQLLRAARGHQALPGALDALADDLARQAEDGRTIQLAMGWPLAVGAVIVSVMLVLAVYVVPAFDEVYDQFGAALPLETSLLLAFSRAMVRHAWWWAPLLALVVVAARFRVLPAWATRPVVGAWGKLRFVRRYDDSRFTVRLLRWLRWGEEMPVLRAAALAHLGATMPTGRLARAAQAVGEALGQGAGLAVALGRGDGVPKRLALLAQLGERFGDMGAALDQLDELAEGEAQAAAVHHEQGCLLALYALLGATVVAALTAVYLPIFKLGAIV